MSNYIGRNRYASVSSNVFAHPEHVGSSIPQRILWAFGLKRSISCYFFFPQKWGEDLKLAGETAGMKIPSMEDRRAWNKLPTTE